MVRGLMVERTDEQNPGLGRFRHRFATVIRPGSSGRGVVEDGHPDTGDKEEMNRR